MFNNDMDCCGIIAPLSKKPDGGKRGMHETMARLYEAATKIRGISGQTPVANLLNVSPQRVRNWEERGVSLEGMLDAQEILGCNAVWLRKGAGPMLVGEPVPIAPHKAHDGLADSLKLTAETAAELQLLTVYRLSNQENRRMIEISVEAARDSLSLSTVFNKRQ